MKWGPYFVTQFFETETYQTIVRLGPVRCLNFKMTSKLLPIFPKLHYGQVLKSKWVKFEF